MPKSGQIVAIDESTLWYLRNAAWQLLKVDPGNANHESILAAIEDATKILDRGIERRKLGRENTSA
jgi:hypothetical protein